MQLQYSEQRVTSVSESEKTTSRDFQEELLGDLIEHLGEAKTRDLLIATLDHIEERAACIREAHAFEALRDEAHALVSLAWAAGLARVAHLAREFFATLAPEHDEACEAVRDALLLAVEQGVREARAWVAGAEAAAS